MKVTVGIFFDQLLPQDEKLDDHDDWVDATSPASNQKVAVPIVVEVNHQTEDEGSEGDEYVDDWEDDPESGEEIYLVVVLLWYLLVMDSLRRCRYRLAK